MITSFAGLKLWQSLLIAFCLSTLASFFAMTINRPYRKTMRYGDWVTYCALHGKDYLLSLLATLSPSSNIVDGKDYVLIDGQAVFLWAKFSGISPDSIANMCSVCIKDGIDLAYVLCNESNKNSLYFAERISNVKLEFCNLKRVYKSAALHDLLPNKTQRPNFKHLISTIIHSMLDRSNVKRFVLVSAILLIFSFITPLTGYYLIISSIALVLALLCLVKDAFVNVDSRNDPPDEDGLSPTDSTADVSASDDDTTNNSIQ